MSGYFGAYKSELPSLIFYKKNGTFGSDKKEQKVPQITLKVSGSGFFDPAASEATGADFHSPCRAINLSTNINEIRLEFPTSSIFCMTDIVAEHAFFSADFTFT